MHFGHGLQRTIAEKLLCEVARECDPELQRMPYCIAMQIGIEHVLEVG